MRAICRALLVFLILAGNITAQPASISIPIRYLEENEVDSSAILTPPPADNSPTTRKELDELLKWQKDRTVPQIRRCEEQIKMKSELFRDIMGRRFREEYIPHTFDLLLRVNAEVDMEVNRAKQKWNRPRPQALEKLLRPCVPCPPNSAYPSGHAAISYVLAKVLCEIVPEKKEALMKRADQIGQNRVVAGLHYPSDFDAGQKLGQAFFEKYMQNEVFLKDLKVAQEECRAKLYHAVDTTRE